MIAEEPWLCWCGSRRAEHIATFKGRGDHRFPLVQCHGCGMQSIHPQPDDATLLSYYAADYYGSTRKKFIGFAAILFAMTQAHRARQLGRLAPPGGRVLDVGCGNGDFLRSMQRRGFRVEGTEWTKESADRIPAGSGISVHVGDVLNLDLPERTYDLITMWHVLEHVRQPFQTLNRIRQLLKTNGTLVLALPNVESDQARRYGSDWFHYDPPRHLNNFGLQSLRRLLDASGFSIESVSTKSLDQNAFGEVQSWFNAKAAKHGWQRDQLYELLRGNRRLVSAAAITDLFWFGVMAIPALLRSTWEATRGRGATMIVTTISSEPATLSCTR